MISFQTNVNEKGQLRVPKKYLFKNANYNITIEFPGEKDSIDFIEKTAIIDNSDDFLSKKELEYYLNLSND